MTSGHFDALAGGGVNVQLGSLCCSSDPALKFNQKYLHLCSNDERRSYGVGTAWG